MYRRFILTLLVALAIIFALSCGDDSTGSSNQRPAKPVNDVAGGSPANDAVNISVDPTLKWTCSDPDGDVLTYTVKFGTSPVPQAITPDQSDSTFTPATLEYFTTYYWSVIAKDPAGAKDSMDVRHFTTKAEAMETVSAPTTITGATSGVIDVPMTFTASGAISSEGHDLEYKFGWGDMSFSDWTPPSSMPVSHTFTSAGTFLIIAQARCARHPLKVSDWSEALSVEISDP